MSPCRSHRDNVQEESNPEEKGLGIGDIFRDWGEIYIKKYNPTLNHVKFIRAVRICKTPGLGGKAKKCNDCNAVHYIYFSCGHSRCPLCGSIKAEQWLDKLQALLLNVPYVHLVTTLPRELKRLCRDYPKEMYNLLFQATKQTIWLIAQNKDHLGATPGMISILHTWGSDMKYHVHTHSLLTFGGMDDKGNWQYPKHKKRLCRNSKLRSTFRDTFLMLLGEAFKKGVIPYQESYGEIVSVLKGKRWTVFVTHPTMNSKTIEEYLGRYINKIAVSDSRVTYVKESMEVRLIYNDYRQQKEGEVAPKEIKRMSPLIFIHQLLSHLPPPYFWRTRRYGLHAICKGDKAKQLIENRARKHPRAIRTVMEIITHLMGLAQLACKGCGGTDFETIGLSPNKDWKFKFITLPTMRSP